MCQYIYITIHNIHYEYYAKSTHTPVRKPNMSVYIIKKSNVRDLTIQTVLAGRSGVCVCVRAREGGCRGGGGMRAECGGVTAFGR